MNDKSVYADSASEDEVREAIKETEEMKKSVVEYIITEFVNDLVGAMALAELVKAVVFELQIKSGKDEQTASEKAEKLSEAFAEVLDDLL